MTAPHSSDFILLLLLLRGATATCESDNFGLHNSWVGLSVGLSPKLSRGKRNAAVAAAVVAVSL